MANRTRGGLNEPQPHTYIVQASAITSRETYLYPDGSRENVLRGLYLEVKRGECWGIIGDEPFEVELLMQIIGNVRPYASGRCVLVERGMMRQKRRILPHVFTISGGDTVPGNLNTLEYLMYVTAHFDVPDARRQADILEMLLAAELYHLTLVPMEWTVATGIAVLIVTVMMTLLLIFVLPKFRKMQTLTDNLNRVTMENLTGVRVVRAYNAEEYQNGKFEVANQELTRNQLYTSRGMSPQDGYKTQTLGTLVVGLASMVGVMIVSLFLH